MNQHKTYLTWLLRIFLSFVFLFSAYAKLYPSAYFAITTFEMKQLVPLGFSECWAPYFSRFIIGAEIALGLGFLQPHFLRKLILPLSALLLVIFNIHLAYSIINEVGGNCGCFGDLLPMTPMQAFIKNVVILGLIIWLWKIIEESDKKVNHNFFVALSVALASILFMFVYVPITPCKIANSTNEIENNYGNVVLIDDEDIDDIPVVDTENNSTETPIENPKQPIKEAINTPNTENKNTYEPPKVKSGFAKYAPNIDEGKKLLLFFAPGCDHCQEAAHTLVEMSKKDKAFPKMFIIFMDEETEKIPAFFEKAGRKISHTILDVGTFWGAIGTSRDTPGVLYLWNGNQVVFFDGINENEFKEDKLKKALEKKTL
jgi:thiol-disulfide isomerase/thioredoxin